MIYLKKNWKNQIFLIFLSKSMLTTCLQRPISQICAKKIQNWVYLCFRKVLKLKVTKGELIISNGLEMADDYLLGGGAPGAPSPGPVRVKSKREPPYLSWLWIKFLLKNHVSPKAGINSNSFGSFSEYFFQKLQKNWG